MNEGAGTPSAKAPPWPASNLRVAVSGSPRMRIGVLGVFLGPRPYPELPGSAAERGHVHAQLRGRPAQHSAVLLEHLPDLGPFELEQLLAQGQGRGRLARAVSERVPLQRRGEMLQRNL